METETQVAKILIGDNKQATSFVFLVAENSPFSNAELFMVMELPLFNPAAKTDCERITNSVAAAFRRSLNHEINDLTFENALAQINEEMGKLVNIGQTNWVGKLNALLALKFENTLYVSTSGKIIAMMLRDKELINLADSPKQSHPLKTFENFATGKIKLQDKFLFSTTNFFNYISIEKFKQTAVNLPLSVLTQNFSQTLEDLTGPDTAIATLIIHAIEPGVNIDNTNLPPIVSSTVNEPASIKPPITRRNQFNLSLTTFKNNFVNKFKKLFFNIFNRKPRTQKWQTESSSVNNRLINLSNHAKAFVGSAKIKYSSKQKIFFLIASVILLLALAINLLYTRYVNQQKTLINQTVTNLNGLENLLLEAENTLNYGNKNQSYDYLQEFNKQADTITNLSPDAQKQLQELQIQAKLIFNKLDNTLIVTPKPLTNLTGETPLINTNTDILLKNSNERVFFNLANSQSQPVSSGCLDKYQAGLVFQNTNLILYTGESLIICDPKNNTQTSSFTGMVPASHEFGGMADSIVKCTTLVIY